VLFAGYVSTSKPAPAAPGDDLYVVIPDLSPDLSMPCQWLAGSGSALPQQGADVLVAYDNRGASYVVWWEQESTGVANFTSPTATTATAGTRTLPSSPAGFLEINVSGTLYKLPYYNP
jgi:hypothetical protein